MYMCIHIRRMLRFEDGHIDLPFVQQTLQTVKLKIYRTTPHRSESPLIFWYI